MKKIEKYHLFEVLITDVCNAEIVEYCAVFEKDGIKKEVPAYKRARDEYIVRFMPEDTGKWTYHIHLSGQSADGEFECVENTGNNHGPVLADGYHFRYADGSRFIPIGTTCYAWIHQPGKLQEETVKTLKAAPFNKIRMCIFPKSMPYNNNDPEHYPFRKNAGGEWDVQDLDFAFWDNLDQQMAELAQIGVEADLILFHPYDRWGFAALCQEDSLAYLEYCIARLSAYRNVWWSLANEYELVYQKSTSDWNAYGEMLKKRDPYGHLISIHNIFTLYPKRDWMTHCSIQSSDINHIAIWQKEYGLPVLIDECGYEGDIEYGWGNLSAFEMVHRFWWTVCRGGYCTHGETFHREDEVLWWAKGGKLYGESGKRISFLKELLYHLPGEGEAMIRPFGMNPNSDKEDAEAVKQNEHFQKLLDSLPEHKRDALISLTPTMISGDDYRLQYFGHTCPAFVGADLPRDGKYRVEVLDIWEMTRTLAVDGICGQARIGLPGKVGIAVLITRMEGDSLKIT